MPRRPKALDLPLEERQKAIEAIPDKASLNHRGYDPVSSQEHKQNVVRSFYDMRKHGDIYAYKNHAFSRDELIHELQLLVDFCAERAIPVNINMISTWLGTTRETIHQWENDHAYGFSDILKRFKDDIVNQRLLNGECNVTNPIFSMFVLKTQHGFIETSNLNIKAEASQGQSGPLTEKELERTAKALEAANIIE